MTGISTFTPGSELHCLACEFCIGPFTAPDCLIAVEMRDEGEPMSAACCPSRVDITNLTMDDVAALAGIRPDRGGHHA
jgi:hypothetical protein